MWLGGRGLPNMSKAPDSIPTSTKKGGGGVVQWVKVLATKSGNLSWISKVSFDLYLFHPVNPLKKWHKK